MAAVDTAYVEVLGRHIDPDGAATYRDLIATHQLTADDVPGILIESPEYLLGRSGFYHLLHASRTNWCSQLPAWDRILDIGGSSPTHELGALLELGYPHHPSELHILDRPEDDQFHGRPIYDQRIVRKREWGTVTFHHGDAGNLDAVPDLGGRRFDAVFMGQVIEHIPTHELPGMLAQIRSHLVDRGAFVFDTPNRSMTKLIMGEAFLSGDHTHEYDPEEMVSIVSRHGFTVEKVVGIHHMPTTRSLGVFDPKESAHSPDGAPADECFCFAVHCRAD